MLTQTQHTLINLWCEVNHMDYNHALCADGHVNILRDGKLILKDVPLDCLHCAPVIDLFGEVSEESCKGCQTSNVSMCQGFCAPCWHRLEEIAVDYGTVD